MSTRRRDTHIHDWPFESDAKIDILFPTGGVWKDGPEAVTIRVTEADSQKLIGEIGMSVETFSRAALLGHANQPGLWKHWSDNPLAELEDRHTITDVS